MDPNTGATSAGPSDGPEVRALRISLVSGWSPPWEGEREWNANRGGPHALLG